MYNADKRHQSSTFIFPLFTHGLSRYSFHLIYYLSALSCFALQILQNISYASVTEDHKLGSGNC